jgi:hypothetical protein
MLIPVACLWLSRNTLGLDDPVSDNLAANVVGLFLGLVARFYLFRTLVFQRPVVLPDLVQHPLQVLEMSELTPEAPDAAEIAVAAEAGAGELSGPTGRSTTGRAPRSAP